jgi:hypothetical protein
VPGRIRCSLDTGLSVSDVVVGTETVEHDYRLLFATREVLERMQKAGRDWLPVVTAQGQLDGVVDRSRLTASVILDVTNQLRAGSSR